MKIITWNVDGLRACLKDGLGDYLLTADADIVALQETKVNEPLPELMQSLPGYAAEWNYANRLGYSGTVCLHKVKPLSIKCGLGDEKLDGEGRLITLEYPDFYFLNTYTPHSPMGRDGLDRRRHRTEYDTAFAAYIDDTQNLKPVIIGGDFNVAYSHIDVYPENQRNVENPENFATEEQGGLESLFEIGLVDVFRKLHPTERTYTWWSVKPNFRKENRGRRLDYFLASNELIRKVKSCTIRTDITGSDHAPIELVVKI